MKKAEGAAGSLIIKKVSKHKDLAAEKEKEPQGPAGQLVEARSEGNVLVSAGKENDGEKQKDTPDDSGSDEERETTAFPPFLMVLANEDFQVKNYWHKDYDSKTQKFFKKKVSHHCHSPSTSTKKYCPLQIGTTLDNAKVYKKKYDSLPKGKEGGHHIGFTNTVHRDSHIKLSWETPKAKACILQRDIT